jgi:hypothetical protein
MNRAMPKLAKVDGSDLLAPLFGIAGLVLGVAASVIRFLVDYYAPNTTRV